MTKIKFKIIHLLLIDLIFLQITKKTEEEWISDPNGFFEYDTNDSYIHYATVRATAKDVLIVSNVCCLIIVLFLI